MPATQVYQAQTTFTDAQIKTLPTSSHDIIPAAGADKIILPFYAVCRLEWVADYTNIDAGALLKFTIGSAGGLLLPFRQDVLSAVSGLLAGGGPDGSLGWTPSAFQGLVAAAPGSIVASGSSSLYDSDVVNLPLSFSADNGGSGNFTGGNAGNSLKVTVLYTIIDV